MIQLRLAVGHATLNRRSEVRILELEQMERPRHTVEAQEVSPQGRLMHELVRVATTLRNHVNPDVTFAMSKTMERDYAKRKRALTKELGLNKMSKPEQDAQIDEMREVLLEEGIPHWVQLPPEQGIV